MCVSSEDVDRQSALGYVQDTAVVAAVVSSFPCGCCLAVEAGKAERTLQATAWAPGAGSRNHFSHPTLSQC